MAKNRFDPAVLTQGIAPYIIGLILLSMIGAYVVYDRDTVRPPRDIATKAQVALDRAKAQNAALLDAKKLPPLLDSWTRAEFMLSFCGLKLMPALAQANGPSEGGYTGPAAHWRVTVAGRPIQVLTCVNDVVEAVPAWPETLILDGGPVVGNATLTLVVLGSVSSAR